MSYSNFPAGVRLELLRLSTNRHDTTRIVNVGKRRRVRLTHPEEFYAWCTAKVLGAASVDSWTTAECNLI